MSKKVPFPAFFLLADDNKINLSGPPANNQIMYTKQLYSIQHWNEKQLKDRTIRVSISKGFEMVDCDVGILQPDIVLCSSN